ncbi:multidrug ABC transporter ATP-binding protein [Chloroflexus islandicus]|uniref:Multidrug ABC transporter ATP-binding protein n=1 Tax=Chloroflexus islandicus TaxID=1707952 RepID=A0A178LUF5_9CHLR|nr:ABC transporter ATP-binding protein [Chloroflexus islandicus]OAN37101.1 multidrug ABC transporter ATP-binding protein [Chloroflexus islandicus]
MTAIVETKNLTRYYGEHLALNHLNLQIPAGAVYGFIGPNGAGKTTTMRILTTLLRPSGGEAWVAGLSVTHQRAEVRRAVGFMPDSFGFYNNMTAAEYLDFFAAAYHVPPARRPALIDDLLALVDLGHKRDSDVMSLSRGMKQRLSLARTLIHDPQLLILDEPASGLDPRARVELRELLRELRRLGKTIMISSHILTELAEMCTHIGIIERGTLLASGDVETIMRSLRPHRTFVAHVISDAQAAAEVAAAAEHVLAVRVLNDDGPPRIEVDIDGDDHAVSALLARLVSHQVEIVHFAAQTSNLEEIFLKVTEGVVG